MELERIIEILEKHQECRRDQNVQTKTEMQSPIEIGIAIDYAISELKKLRLGVVISWVSVEKGLPNELETVWVSNGKGWTTLGCLVYAEDGWHWAESNGLIYQENGKIVSECESDDLDVKFWHRLPDPPCL